MDILVLDAPMKFIHGKMVEQGAKEWSRYLTSLFNPLGRGSLYTEHFDKEHGLTVYLYSALITLECVGENKGYLKVVKATETDVVAYHKAVEEGKLLEEKITFVPVYKFQYINGKEHHDVERFMELEKKKRDFESYVKLWEGFIAEGATHKVTNKGDSDKLDESANEDRLSQLGVKNALKALYERTSANKAMPDFMPTAEKVSSLEVATFDEQDFSMHYDHLTAHQKKIITRALSTEDIYFMDTNGITSMEEVCHKILPIIRELVQQISRRYKVLVVEPETLGLQALLEDLEAQCDVEMMQLIGEVKLEEYPFALEQKVQQMKDKILKKLNDEASKHNRHKEELDQMRAECDVYQYAEKVIRFSFEILATLKEVAFEKLQVQEESRVLGEQGISYMTALNQYEAMSEEEHKVYSKLKEEFKKSDHLYEDVLWMRTYEHLMGYEDYKALILEYGRTIYEFEEKLLVYKAQMQQKSQYEAEYKALDAKLLEKRRQYLKVEAISQIEANSSEEILESTASTEKREEILLAIQDLEGQLQDLRKKQEEMTVGITHTRHLDALKAKVYGLKVKVEDYMVLYQEQLQSVCDKEDITKADVLEVFERMNKVESLFEKEETYTTYIEGIESYLELEVIVEKNKQLLKLQEANQEQMTGVLKKEQELMSLLTTKLTEEAFNTFVHLTEEAHVWVEQILKNPLDDTSIEYLDKLKAAVEQHEYKIQVYKEKVAFYEELAKIKEKWQTVLETQDAVLMKYLLDRINVVGTTCEALVAEEKTTLSREDFEYVLINKADQIADLELLIPMIRGKRVILIGDSKKQSLFARLYERCLETHKSILKEV